MMTSELMDELKTMQQAARSRCLRWRLDGRFSAAEYWDGYQMALEDVMDLIRARESV